jgi:surface antigen
MNKQLFSEKKVSIVKAHKSRARRFRKKVTKYGLLTLNVSLVLAVLGFLLYGRHVASEPAVNVASSREDTEQVTVLDQVSAADIAVHIAEAVRLPEVDQVRNQADSRNSLISIAVSDDVVVSKPQIVTDATTGSQSRKDITTYVSVAGDTVSALAERYNVSSDSIRWSNGLTGDTISAGKQLVIPPRNRNGVVYKVSSGDTIEKIVEKYKSSADKLIAFNDLELSNSLPVDEYIFIPEGIKPPDPVQTTRTAGANVSVSGTYVARYGSNGYAAGYCTWWAADRRAQLGRPIPSNLGNAITWLAIAQSIGMGTGTVPQPGAVVWFRFPWTSLGHVGIVESVNPDGSFVLSEMNGRAGWGRVSEYTVTPAEVDEYRFIY